MTAFYVLGGVLAAWALIVTALGVTQHDFPGKGRGERTVGAISVVLVVAALGAAIIGSANEEEEPGDEAEAAQEEAPPGGAPPEGEAPPGGEAPGGEAPAGGGELELTADPSGQLSFDKTELTAAAGKVTIVMTNPSPVPHNVAVEGSGVDEKGEIVSEGDTSTVAPELEAGEYTFYCSVPGHREGGMEGTLTVSG